MLEASKLVSYVGEVNLESIVKLRVSINSLFYQLYSYYQKLHRKSVVDHRRDLTHSFGES